MNLDRHPAHGDRALAHTAFALAAVAFLCIGLASCDRTNANPSAKTPEWLVADLVEACTPLDDTHTSDVEDAWFINYTGKVAKLKKAPPEVGREALRFLREVGHEAVNVDNNVLAVAAHSAPEDTLPYLEELIMEYGHEMHLRTEAVMLLGEIHPERAMEMLDPLLRVERHTKTYPNAEFMVRAYINAAELTDTDPTDLLVDVTTNIWQEDAARHFAVKGLANYPSPLQRQALEITLKESTGNGYLRRMAAQSLQKSLPREVACEVITEVADREADENFLVFLIDMINENCR